MHLYKMDFQVFRRQDALHLQPIPARGFVSAECPFEALYFIRSRVARLPFEMEGDNLEWQKIELPDLEEGERFSAEAASKTHLVVVDILDNEALEASVVA